MTKPAKPSKFYTRHMEALKSGTYPEGLIRGLKFALNADGRRSQGYSTGRSSAKVTSDELGKIMQEIYSKPPRVEAKQSEKGLAWLRNKRNYKTLGEREKHIVDNFHAFQLVEMYDAGTRGGVFMIPVYRVISTDGKYFDYIARSWQAGGGDGVDVIN